MRPGDLPCGSRWSRVRPKTPFSSASTRVAVLAGALAGVLAGCAAPCKKVRDDRQAFLDRSPAARSPHLSLSVPFAVIDQMIAAQVGALPPVRVPMPAIAGVSSGALALRIERVRTRPAPPGQLGFVITAALSSGKTRVLGLDIEATVTPTVDPKSGEVVIALEGRSIRSIAPKLDRRGARELADFVWKQLPSAARMLTSKKQIEQLAAGASEELMREAFALVKRELLDDLGEITRIELDLPDMPLAAADLSTAAEYLTIDVRTTLPVARGLGGPGGRVQGVHPNVVQVRIAGPTAAELANYAMETGDIPERWNMDGEPEDDGPLYAGLAWNEAEGKPLLLHLWSLDEDCAHVVMGATPRVSLAGEHLQLQTNDAKIERVEGPLKVRAGIWFSGLGRRSFAFVEQTAASFDFEVGGQPLSARVQSAALTGDELVLGLKLDRQPARRSRSR